MTKMQSNMTVAVTLHVMSNMQTMKYVIKMGIHFCVNFRNNHCTNQKLMNWRSKYRG